MNQADRYALLLDAVEDLIEENQRIPVLVEGVRDVRALRAIGLTGEILTVNTGGPLLELCERLGRRHRAVLLLTDWDRRGGQLAQRLREGFAAIGVDARETPRAKLAFLSQKEVKDVESLDAYVQRAREAVGNRPPEKASKRWYTQRQTRRGRSGD